MKQKILIAFICIFTISLKAQNDSIIRKILVNQKKTLNHQKKIIDDSIKKIDDSITKLRPPQKWIIKGTNSLIFNQNAFFDWFSGGNNSFGANVRINYDLNYKKNKNILENKIILGYGHIANKDEKPKKTDDILSFSSIYGRKISEKWYLSTNINFLTQFINGYNYSKSREIEISSFMSPGYINTGFGFEYKAEKILQIYIRPVTTKMTFVLNKTLQNKGNYGLKNNGDYFLVELGGSLAVRYKGKLSDNITYDNNFVMFSNYLEDTDKIDINYSGQMNFKINKWFTSQLTLDILYDHNQIEKTQFKQTLGIGLAYNFSN